MFSTRPSSVNFPLDINRLSLLMVKDDVTDVWEKPSKVSTISKGAFCGIRCEMSRMGKLANPISKRLIGHKHKKNGHFPEQTA